MQHFGKKVVLQPQGLISVLLNKSPENYDRNDAAMDLGAYDDAEAERALISVVTDLNEDEDIADSAGESLLEIWNRKNKSDLELISKMHPAAKKFFRMPK